jgi:hypothetical protein
MHYIFYHLPIFQFTAFNVNELRVRIKSYIFQKERKGHCDMVGYRHFQQYFSCMAMASFSNLLQL